MGADGSNRLAGLTVDLTAALAAAPVGDKALLELAVDWSGLSPARARMAAALRLFVLTWDPLEVLLPRPPAFATVNADPGGLLVVYVPLWSATEAADERGAPLAVVLAEWAGSAVVVTADAEPVVLAGRYPTLVQDGAVPHPLSELQAGAGLGSATLTLVSDGWQPIGLGAITDVVQDRFGPLDLDRSPVGLARLPRPALRCPGCQDTRFGFPAELAEATPDLCSPHRLEANRVTTERLERAGRSNPDGWGALTMACERVQLPHLPNGLLARLVSFKWDRLLPDWPAALAAQAAAVLEAAETFTGRADDFAVALGADPDLPNLPDWLTASFVLALGHAGLGTEAAAVGDALIRVDPAEQTLYDADIAVALAEAGQDEHARQRIAAMLSRWPDELWVRVHAGDALQALDDDDGAEVHFLAALEMTERAHDRDSRGIVADRLTSLGRPVPARGRVRGVATGRSVAPTQGAVTVPTVRQRRNEPCSCGSGRRYKRCHGSPH